MKSDKHFQKYMHGVQEGTGVHPNIGGVCGFYQQSTFLIQLVF